MKLIGLILSLIFVHAAQESFTDAISDAFTEDVDHGEVPFREDGMLYSVPETVAQFKNYFSGFMVGFYHNPNAKVSEQCLNVTDYRDFAFVLKMVYEKESILHFLDIFKFSGKLVQLIQSTFEFCGPKVMIEDIKNFCNLEKKRCTAPIMLTSAWSRMIVLTAQSSRVVVDTIRLAYYAYYRTSLSMAAESTADKIYDIADDLGSITRYTLDFHLPEEFEIGEFD